MKVKKEKEEEDYSSEDEEGEREGEQNIETGRQRHVCGSECSHVSGVSHHLTKMRTCPSGSM